jgi:hypothetical protein
MLRFTLRDLFAGTTLIAMGVIALSWILPPSREASSEVLLLWFFGGMMLGAGAFVPFKRVWLGAGIGLLSQLLLLDVLEPQQPGAMRQSTPADVRQHI